MMKSIILIGALIALLSFAAADVSETEGGAQPASEDPVQRIHVLNPGEKEYLSPNLIGVQNIAVTNLPVTIDFVNIIDAFREVVDGVRYEIVLNALNTTDNNTEIVCRLVVLEKPWLTTLWGDKVRLLRESNCTSDELNVSDRDRKSIEEKYQTNALFTGSRNELTADDMSKLESQIIFSSSPQLTRQRKTTTTVRSSVIEQVTEPVVVTTPTDTQPEAGIRDDIVVNTAAEAESPIVSTEDSATTTSTETIPELSDDEKRWLDDFLSIGAYNFETTLQNKKAKTSEATAAASTGNDETQQSGQPDDDERARRGIAGGIQQLTPEELKVEQDALAVSLSKLATGDGPSYTIVAVHSGTRQIVSGTLTKLDADLRDGKSGEVIRCIVSLWAQPWLPEDGYEVKFECPNQPERVHRHSRSVDEREKRGIKGGIRQLDAQELKVEEAELVASLSKLSTGDGPSYTVVKVYSGTKQVVSGSLTKLDVDLLDGKTKNTIRCIVSLWAQPWLPKDGYEVKFVCPNQPESVHRHSRRSIPERTRRGLPGGIRQLDAQELKLEEEALSKSLSTLASGDGPSYTIVKVHSGTKQVVSGSLTKLDVDLREGMTGNTIRCKVSLWAQPWLKKDGYEVKFECPNQPESVHRHSRSVDEVATRQKRSLVGAPRSLSADELKEEEDKISASLATLASGPDGPNYKIVKTFSGTRQIVAGTLVKADVLLRDENTGLEKNCTISRWSRPWIQVDGYEISFECDGEEKTSRRHSRSVEYAQKKSHKKNHRSLDKAEHLFQKFQNKFSKKYHSSMERQMRLRIFKHNLKLIQDLNKNEMGSAKYGITEFADMTTTEYRERTGLMPREDSNAVRSQAKIPDVELPKEFDWREKGVISQVKNQGNCGSCWAFSVTGNIEGLHAVKTGKLEEYSEQELLDCDTVDSACQGGLPDNAYQAIEKIGGLELESEYPYEAKKGNCHFNSTLSRVKISGAVDLPKNETQMAQWLLTNGPISIGINANAMQFYRGGVSHPWKVLCSKGNLDHGVLIVGYGVSEYPMFKKTLPYWIVKNSWGPKWGEQGYYRVYRGDNTCGVSEMATSAILA